MSPAGEPGVDGPYVMVPVPADRVLDVYAFLGTARTDPSGADGEDARWSEADMSRLLASVRSVTTRRVFAYLAKHPEKWVSIKELCDALHVSNSDLRASLSGLTRTIKAKFGRSDWPIQVVSERDGTSLRTAYRMPSDIASVVPDLDPDTAMLLPNEWREGRR